MLFGVWRAWAPGWVWLLTIATIASIGAGTALLVTREGPSRGHRDEVVIVPCPSEDSCTVDYYDGAWHIGPPGSH